MKKSCCCLVSGGKDSAYVMMKAIEDGYNIVCLASFYHEEGEELDSWMFQSVTTNVVISMSECLGYPMYRMKFPKDMKILNKDLEYFEIAKEINEVEIIYALLYKIKQDHPEVTAVTSGAIYSSYQKNRVVHVCERLGLTSLAYLWHRNQEELLTEMVANEVHAILVKVACMGLTNKHVGRSIAEMLPILKSLNAKFGIHICGEGGEFESLTLDCPLYRKRIVIDNFSLQKVDDNDIAPVSYLKILDFHLEDKPDVEQLAEKPAVIEIPPEYRLDIPDRL